MHNLSTTSLQSLHELMTRMFIAIENSDWDELMTLDHERRKVLEGYISSRSTYDDNQENSLSKCTDSSSEREHLSSKIIKLDKEMLETLKRNRLQLMTESHTNSAQQNAAAGYAQTSAFI